jgi:hypothetical protein
MYIILLLTFLLVDSRFNYICYADSNEGMLTHEVHAPVWKTAGHFLTIFNNKYQLHFKNKERNSIGDI